MVEVIATTVKDSATIYTLTSHILYSFVLLTAIKFISKTTFSFDVSFIVRRLIKVVALRAYVRPAKGTLLVLDEGVQWLDNITFRTRL